MLSYFFGGSNVKPVLPVDESDAGAQKSPAEKRKQRQKAEAKKKQKQRDQLQQQEVARDSDDNVDKQQNLNRQQQQPKNASSSSSKKEAEENNVGEGEEEVPPPPQQNQSHNAPMIAIIPLKFAQYLDPVLVQQIEQLPANSKRRLKARNIVKNNNDLIQMGQSFDNAFIDQLTHELTLLIEVGSSMEKHMRTMNIGHQQHFQNKSQTTWNGGLNFDVSGCQFKPMPNGTAANLMPPPPPALSAADDFPPPVSGADWQIALQQQQQQLMMATNSTTQMAQSMQQQFGKTAEQLLSCTTANLQLQLGQALPMANQFNLQAAGQQENLQMMLNSSTPMPQFEQMNFGSSELIQQPQMNMQGIAEGIEKANKKSYNAYGTRAIEFMEKFEHEQNFTARDHVQQAQLSNRHNSDNVLKQNMHMMNVKSDVMSKKEINENNQQFALKQQRLQMKQMKMQQNFAMQQNAAARSNSPFQQQQFRPSSSASVASSCQSFYRGMGSMGDSRGQQQQQPQGEANQKAKKKMQSKAGDLMVSSEDEEADDDDEKEEAANGDDGLVSEPEDSSSSGVDEWGDDDDDENDEGKKQ